MQFVQRYQLKLYIIYVYNVYIYIQLQPIKPPRGTYVYAYNPCLFYMAWYTHLLLIIIMYIAWCYHCRHVNIRMMCVLGPGGAGSYICAAVDFHLHTAHYKIYILIKIVYTKS